jgi:integrase
MHGQWFVRRAFPSEKRDSQNRRKYTQIARLCEPETQERAAELAVEIEQIYFAAVNGVIAEAARVKTVGEFLTERLAIKEGSIERATHVFYEGLLRRHVQPYQFAALPLDTLNDRDADHAQKLYRDLKEAGVPPATIRKVHKVLRSEFAVAHRRGKLQWNPCDGAILPKAPRREIHYFTKEQARKLVEFCRKSDEFIIFELALETGMRPGEYLALSWNCVSASFSTIQVKRALESDLPGGGFGFKGPKSEASKRFIDLSPQLAERLKRQKEIVEERKVRFRKLANGPAATERQKVERRRAREALKAMTEYDLVFPSPQLGVPISRKNLRNRQLEKLLEGIGLTGRGQNLYSFRHTCVTLMIEAGVDLKTIADKLGHADPTLILRTYGHVLDSMKTRSTEKLAAALYDSGP